MPHTHAHFVHLGTAEVQPINEGQILIAWKFIHLFLFKYLHHHHLLLFCSSFSSFYRNDSE